ncbi:hypothetical protein [Mycobacterium sp. E1747]|uniref:hypothetical protein n=1 Tax=Mycobacterium sp. E1747 TaxID=1834128 RepID=UPI0007FE0AE9|nr:hypothetical protein [Mycobacterium sp. E1747]OBH06431.1 hypothetical protein A5695_05525 [Mycobacterium sp. E1747]
MIPLHGIELRYVLALHLWQHGPATVSEMVDLLGRQGFRVRGRPSKTVSDALRWEIARGRVRQLRRGRYGPEHIPHATEYRIIHRVQALREAAKLSL